MEGEVINPEPALQFQKRIVLSLVYHCVDVAVKMSLCVLCVSVKERVGGWVVRTGLWV